MTKFDTKGLESIARESVEVTLEDIWELRRPWWADSLGELEPAHSWPSHDPPISIYSSHPFNYVTKVLQPLNSLHCTIHMAAFHN